MQIETQTLAIIALPTVAGLVWLVRLEGRVNTSEARFADLQVDLKDIKADVKALLLKK